MKALAPLFLTEFLPAGEEPEARSAGAVLWAACGGFSRRHGAMRVERKLRRGVLSARHGERWRAGQDGSKVMFGPGAD